jgi:hypothetical protein
MSESTKRFTPHRPTDTPLRNPLIAWVKEHGLASPRRTAAERLLRKTSPEVITRHNPTMTIRGDNRFPKTR